MITKYLIICKIGSVAILLLISSIDYITRLALLIKVFIKSGSAFMMLDLKFLGLTYIIVYVGAISILFLFVIKMTDSGRAPNIEINPRKKGTRDMNGRPLIGPSSYARNPKAGIRLEKLVAGVAIYFCSKGGTLRVPTHSGGGSIKNHFVSSYSSEFLTITDIESFGYVLYLGYPLATVLLGILLWCVLIGILRICGQ